MSKKITVKDLKSLKGQKTTHFNTCKKQGGSTCG
jgi:hypothetical protein